MGLVIVNSTGGSSHMLHTLRQRARSEKGFTLIELLVVILIIGILAAIALPAFLGQRSKGQDSSAKSDARNAISEVESCFVDNQTYKNCSLTGSGLPVGTDVGQVSVTIGTPDTQKYTVLAKSKSGNTFTIAHDSASGDKRTCTITGGTKKGGCLVATGDAGTW